MIWNAYQVVNWRILVNFLHLKSPIPILINHQMGLLIDPQVFMSFLSVLFALIQCFHLFIRFLHSSLMGLLCFFILINHQGVCFLMLFFVFRFQDWIFMGFFILYFFVILIVLCYVLIWVLILFSFACFYVFRVLDDLWVHVMHNNLRSQLVLFCSLLILIWSSII